MLDFNLKASSQIIKTKVKIACLMLHSPSDQFRSRFHKVIATIPNIIADVKF